MDRRTTGAHRGRSIHRHLDLVALVSAAGWSVLALSRGEEVSAAWMVAAALGSYAIAYRFYSKFIAYKVEARQDPAPTLVEPKRRHLLRSTDRRVLLGHHFAAIAGAGPLVGPVVAVQMGYLPGTIWIIVGVIFAGAVQDMVVLFFSTRRDGRCSGRWPVRRSARSAARRCCSPPSRS